MHPVIGPDIESERLYVAQSRLRERLAAPGPRPRPPRRRPRRRLERARSAPCGGGAARRRPRARDRELRARTSARWPSRRPTRAPRGSPSTPPPSSPHALLAHGRHETCRVVWRLVRGDLLEMLPREDALADVVFWDPFSPKANPALDLDGVQRRARPLRRRGRALHLQHRDRDARRAPPRRLLRRSGRSERTEGADHRRRDGRRAPRAPPRRALARAPRAVERAVPRGRAAGRARPHPRAPQFR